jgi:hypothetical protein
MYPQVEELERLVPGLLFDPAESIMYKHHNWKTEI